MTDRRSNWSQSRPPLQRCTPALENGFRSPWGCALLPYMKVVRRRWEGIVISLNMVPPGRGTTVAWTT